MRDLLGYNFSYNIKFRNKFVFLIVGKPIIRLWIYCANKYIINCY